MIGRPIRDITDDLLLLEGLRPFTLRITGEGDTYLPYVMDEPIGYKEIEASNGQLRQGDVLYCFQRKMHPDRPILGSKLIDDENEFWTILTLTYKDQLELWEAGCRNLAVEAGLDNVATVLRATYVKDDEGEATPTWSVISHDTPARWQPMTEQAEIFEDADYTRTTYRVTFGADPIDRPSELAGGDYRLEDSDGNRYRVMEYIQEERIDRLPVAIVVKVLEGAEYYGISGQ